MQKHKEENIWDKESQLIIVALLDPDMKESTKLAMRGIVTPEIPVIPYLVMRRTCTHEELIAASKID